MNKDKSDPVSHVICSKDNYDKVNFHDPTWVEMQWRDFPHPVGTQTIDFTIPANPEKQFYDINETVFVPTYQLVTDTNAKIPENSNVGLINYFVQTNIEQIVVFAKNVKIWDSSNYYSELSYIHVQMNASKEDKIGPLQGQGYYEDATALSTTADFTKNTANMNRALFFGALTTDKKGVTFDDGEVTFFAKFIGGVFESDGLIPPNVDLTIRITFKPPKYVIWTSEALAANNYKLNLTKVNLFIKRLTCSDAYWKKFLENWNKQPYRLKYCRQDVVPKKINSTALKKYDDHLKGEGLNPRRVTVVLRDEQLTIPNNKFNPLYFTSYFEAATSTEAEPKYAYVVEADLLLQGQPVTPTYGLTSSSRSLHHWHYYSFFNTFTKKTGQCPGLDLMHFYYGRYIMSWDLTLTQRLSETPGVHINVKKGDLRMRLQFDTHTKRSVEALVISEYPCATYFDKNGNVRWEMFDVFD